MKHGIVFPTYLYTQSRRPLVDLACQTLLKTQIPEEKPVLLLIQKITDYRYPDFKDVFDYVYTQDEDLKVSGTEQTLCAGTELLFGMYGMDYVTWIGDDGVYSSNWLMELQELIQRHPEAKSWSVYRSAYTAVHKEIRIESDVLVSSICGHGLTISNEEWQEWGVSLKDSSWPSPYGDTLDLHHVWKRPGDRWVTKKSYIDHMGKYGVHCTGAEPEYAQEFIGIGDKEQ